MDGSHEAALLPRDAGLSLPPLGWEQSCYGFQGPAAHSRIRPGCQGAHRPAAPSAFRTPACPGNVETYQSVPGRPETALRRAEYVASFVGLSPGKAHFIGLYRIGEARELDHDAFWRI